MDLPWRSVRTQQERVVTSIPLGFDEDCATGAGWFWEDETTIALCPDTCNTLADTNAIASITFDASYGCDSIQPTVE